MDDLTASDEAKKALEGVTPKVWRVDRRYSFITHKDTWQVVWDVPNSTALCLVADTGGGGYSNERDARFIAWAREGVPALLAEIAAKDAEIARLTAQPSPDVAALVEAADKLLDAYSAIVGAGNPWGDELRAALARVKGGEA